MRRHLTNAGYGVLDYVAHPLGMLLVAPVVLHKLGAAEYGLWMIATAVISTGGIIASGFCDANMQRVAALRGSGDRSAMVDAVRSTLGINLVLGSVLAAAVWMAAPFAARHIAVSHSVQVSECLICLRIASILILARAIESVAVSTQRAFEEYQPTVLISTGVRILTLASAALLALAGWRTGSILAETGVFLVLGTYVQFRQLCRFLGSVRLWPAFGPGETRVLLSFGVFSWVQAVGSVIFGQLDRVLLGVSLGAVAVAPYALCVQFAQPIYGVTASGLQFLFPYLSGRAGVVSTAALKTAILKAFACNFVVVACGAGMLLLVGDRLIQAWAGVAVAKSAAPILPAIVLGAFLIGLSVTGTYAMQALGLFRTVVGISLTSRAAMLLLMFYLLRHDGLRGLANARVCYGACSLLLYLPLFRSFGMAKTAVRSLSAASIPGKLGEESRV